jgi:hypothetical protein
MPFQSADAWYEFYRYLQSSNRYILSAKHRRFLDTVLRESTTRQDTVDKGAYFYRARIGFDSHTDEFSPLAPPEMVAPPPHKALAGRINPAAIPYLYLGSNVATAIAEVRPWVGAFVSVGLFKIRRQLRIIDLRKELRNQFIDHLFGRKLTPEEIQETIWALINQSFSEPVAPGDELGYIPTQYLAEAFKLHGFHGVLYKSSLHPDGFNLALFSPKYAKLESCGLHRVQGLNYSYRQAGNPYQVRRAR